MTTTTTTTPPVTPPATPPDKPRERHPADRINRWIRNTWKVGPGEIAELRRMQPKLRLSQTYHRLAVDAKLPDTEQTAFIARCFAIGTRPGRQRNSTPHDPRTPLGRALHQSGYRPIRLKKLLNSDGPTLTALVEHMCRRLSQDRQKFNWRDLVQLLREREHHRDTAHDDIRIRVARDYYRAERHIPARE